MFFFKPNSLENIALRTGFWLAHATIGPHQGEVLVPFGVRFSDSFWTGPKEFQERFVVGNYPSQWDVGASSQIAGQWFKERVQNKDCRRALIFADGFVRVHEKRQDALLCSIASIKDKIFIRLFAPYTAATSKQTFTLHTPFFEIGKKRSSNDYEKIDTDAQTFIKNPRSGFLLHPDIRARTNVFNLPDEK